MAKLLLNTPHFTAVHLRTAISSLLCNSPPRTLHAPHRRPPPHSFYCLDLSRLFSIKAYDTKNDDALASEEKAAAADAEDCATGDARGSEYNGDDKYPTGEFEYREYGAWESFLVKCRMPFALPWERVLKGSVLTMKLRGQEIRNGYKPINQNMLVSSSQQNTQGSNQPRS